MTWEVTIGLEIHIQLATNTKIFSGASTQFGAKPNTQACEVDLGFPGVLPVLNKKVIDMAIQFGLGIQAKINQTSLFERKNYFYPDLPKGYQTTQLEKPIIGSGYIDIHLKDGSSKKVRIHHAHLEEDAGKSLHKDYHGATGIDLNRAGTPLIEVVTEPDMHSAEEAVTFAKKIHAIATTLGVCDGNLSQGSMRFDVNISVKPKDQKTLGTRTETKNINSFKFMEAAIIKETNRQIDLLESGQLITQETRLYNGETGEAKSMRSKEEANDYRYFPCPDLLPVIISDEHIQSIKTKMPELPEAKKQRFIAEYNLTPTDAEILSSSNELSNYFELVAKKSDPKLATNWILGEITRFLNTHEITIQQTPVTPSMLIDLLARITDKTISNKIAKKVFEILWNGEDCNVDNIIDKQGLKQVSNTKEIEAIIDKIITNSPKQVANYLQAPPEKRVKMLGFFVGQTMKASQGKANPSLVNSLLQKKLND